MKTIFLSHTELELISRYWDLYVKKRHLEDSAEDPTLQEQMDEVLDEVSYETRETFVDALNLFELQGEEFQVRIAPDDVNLVNA